LVDARLASTDTMARSCWWIEVRVALVVRDSVDFALPDAGVDGILRVAWKGNISGGRLALGLAQNPRVGRRWLRVACFALVG